jgi:hypothetical protein
VSAVSIDGTPFIFGGLMCIKTLYGKNKKLVGLAINGKQFMLNKEVCNALRMEELRSKRDLKLATHEAGLAKKELEKESFFGESPLMDIEVSFGETNQVNSKTARVEFKGKLSEIHEGKRLEYTELLENFLQALNQASEGHQEKIQKAIKEIISKGNKEAS